MGTISADDPQSIDSCIQDATNVSRIPVEYFDGLRHLEAARVCLGQALSTGPAPQRELAIGSLRLYARTALQRFRSASTAPAIQRHCMMRILETEAVLAAGDVVAARLSAPAPPAVILAAVRPRRRRSAT